MMRATIYGLVMKYIAIPLAPLSYIAMVVGTSILDIQPGEAVGAQLHTIGTYLHFYGWVGMFSFPALVTPLIVWHYWKNVTPHAFIEAVESHVGVEEILLTKAREFKRASDADNRTEMESAQASYENMKHWITSKGYAVPHFYDLLAKA